MKKYGISVIKPDAINNHELLIIQEDFSKYKFTKALYFCIKKYCELMKEYREADILFKNCENAKDEIKGCFVALSAFKQLYADGDGLLVLILLG